MTVNELIIALEKLVAEGHGDAQVYAGHEVVEEAVYSPRLEVVKL